MSATEKLIDAGKKATLKSIETDIKAGSYDCLYFATEKQIDTLIEAGKISEDVFSYHQDYQEEMRCIIAAECY